MSIEGSFSGYQRDRIFYNPDGTEEDAQRFFEAGWLFGLDDNHDGRCIVPFDMDGDGDLDLAILSLQGLRLYENRAAPARFARVRLVSTSDATSGLGAIVSLTAGAVTQRDHAKATEGFQSQVPTDLHFGLAEAERIESVRVEWPSGHVDEWKDLPVDRLVVLTEGRSDTDVLAIPRWPETPLARRRSEPASALSAWLDEGLEGRTQVVHWMNTSAADGPLTVSAALPEAREAVGNASWLLVVPEDVDESHLPDVPEGFRFVRWDTQKVEQCFGQAEGPVRPSTFVFRSGDLRRSFYRSVELGELVPLLRSLEDEAPFPELLVWSARRALDEGRPSEALKLFERASEIDPALATAFEGIGRCYVALGELERAEDAYARSVVADPDYGLGHYNLGVSRSQRGRFAEALVSFREALRIQGEQLPTLLAYGEAAAHAGDPLLALEAFERATRSDPTSSAAHQLRGNILGQLRRFDEAVRSLERSLELDPQNQDAQRALDLARRFASEG